MGFRLGRSRLKPKSAALSLSEPYAKSDDQLTQNIHHSGPRLSWHQAGAFEQYSEQCERLVAPSLLGELPG